MKLTPVGLLLLAAFVVLCVAVLWGLRRTRLGHPRLAGTILGSAVFAAILVTSGWGGFPVAMATRSFPLLAGLAFWVVNKDPFEPTVLLQTIALVVAVAGIIGTLFAQSWYGITALAGSGVLIYLAERLRVTM